MSRAALLTGVALVAIVASACSKAERTDTRSGEQPPERPAAVGTGGAAANLKSDDDFVRRAATMVTAQIELSRLALDRSSRPEIKAFAQKMIDDHGADASQLKTAVSGHPIEWPSQLDDKHRETADELGRKQGAEFDRDYVKATIEGQQNLAALLESRLDVQSLADWKTAAAGRTEGKAMPDPKTDLRDVAIRPNKSGNELTMKIGQWAADTYPVTQKHLDTARALENAMARRPTH
jgi:putative membrane protein